MFFSECMLPLYARDIGYISSLRCVGMKRRVRAHTWVAKGRSCAWTIAILFFVCYGCFINP